VVAIVGNVEALPQRKYFTPTTFYAPVSEAACARDPSYLDQYFQQRKLLQLHDCRIVNTISWRY